MWIVIFLLILWFTLPAASAGDSFPLPVEGKALKAIHSEGRARFYSRLEHQSSKYPLEPQDALLLSASRKRLPDLYDRLMNSYFWLHSWEGLSERSFRARYLAVSDRMARELLDSIPAHSPIAGLSPLRLVLRSAGCEASKMAPQFRRVLRDMSRRIKNQWALEELGIPRIHSQVDGEKIRIAVIDTGLDPSIKELRIRARITKNLLDAALPVGEKGRYPYDLDGHGTSVASMINRIAPRAELMIIKFFDEESMQSFPSSRWTGYLLAAALRWAVHHGAHVINLSATIRQDFAPVRDAVRFCWERNVPVIVSMGNVDEDENRSRIDYPAFYPWTIAVGGVEKTEGGLRVWPLSARGDYIDVVAPAIRMRVEVPHYRGRRRKPSLAYGNSYAAAIVSGTAALILESLPEGRRGRLASMPGGLSEGVRNIIRSTASLERLGFLAPNPEAGYGLINILGAVSLAGSREAAIFPAAAVGMDFLTRFDIPTIMEKGYEKSTLALVYSWDLSLRFPSAVDRGIRCYQHRSSGSGFYGGPLCRSSDNQ